jgi:AcrR family transcriptional regulator
VTRRAGLDREGVIRAAAELADAEGLGALTIASLAVRLGVRPPSLYNHTGGLDDLRRSVALLGLRELLAAWQAAAVGRAGEPALAAIAEAQRDYAHAHPARYALTVRAPAPDDHEYAAAAEALLTLLLQVLEPFQMGRADALHAIRGLRALVHGFVMLEAAGGFGLPLDRDESFQRLLNVFLRGLRSQSPPKVA